MIAWILANWLRYTIMFGAAATGIGITYISVKVMPEIRYSKKIPKDAKKYKKCLRETKHLNSCEGVLK